MSKSSKSLKLVPFAIGFRPFFLLGALFAVVSLLIWLHAYIRPANFTTFYGSMGWHAHEMIFGYTMAIIAGFLLTAVANWTERPTITGWPLALLALIWLLGRIFPFFPNSIPAGLISFVDLIFLPCLTIAIAIPIIQSRNKRNYFIPILVFLCGVANLLMHLELLEILENVYRGAMYFGIFQITVIILIVGGRVTPFFSSRVIPGYQARQKEWFDRTSEVSLFLFSFVVGFYPYHHITGILSILAALLVLVRYVGYYHNGVWKIPLLWVLHVSWLWLILGLVLHGLSILQWVGAHIALHALTVGTIGTMTLGMISRVALGHSGRPLQPTKLTVVSFWTIHFSALARIFGPMTLPEYYPIWIQISGGLWVVSFLIYLVGYTTILLTPRPDGKPG